MARGDVITAQQRESMQRSVDIAQREASGLRFSVYVGLLAEGRDTAMALLAQLDEPRRSVLVAIDPATRSVDVITGRDAARAIDDRSCALAVLTMTASLSAGDLVGAVRDGLALLGQHARVPRSLHRDQP